MMITKTLGDRAQVIVLLTATPATEHHIERERERERESDCAQNSSPPKRGKKVPILLLH